MAVKAVMAKCLTILAMVWGSMCSSVLAAPALAVMDFGIYQGTAAEAMTVDDGESASAYIIARLVETKKFDVMDKMVIEENIANEKLAASGVIDADSAKRIGELLGVQYLIYGNVIDVGLDSAGGSYSGIGLNNNTIVAHINLRIIDTRTGQILAVVKGQGESSAAYVKAKVTRNASIKLGNVQVSMDAVHNAVKKAAFDAVDKLVAKKIVF